MDQCRAESASDDKDTPVETSSDTPATMPEGIYFGLDEDAYHADPSLGSGSIRQLARCPIYYWGDSWMNPLREPAVETPALLYGRALHCLVLEGPAEFSKRYAAKISPEDYPEALCTVDEIKAALKAIPEADRKAAGVKLTGSKDELSAGLRLLDPGVQLFDEIKAGFDADCLKNRRTILPAGIYAEIVQGAQLILADPRVSGAFSGGRPEVSIFWTEDGVPMKARLDYVRLGKRGGKPVAVITDLKSFTNTLGRPPEQAVIRSIAETRLDVQVAAYMRGVARVQEFIAAGKVFGGDTVNPEWLATLGTIEAADWQWFWCFYEKGLPVALLRSPTRAVIEGAGMELARALDAYRDNMATFGTAWRFVDPMPEPTVDAGDLPKWMA